jgi:hypothetical protein
MPSSAGAHGSALSGRAKGGFRAVGQVTEKGRVLPIDSLDSLPETCQSSLAALQPTFV